MPKLSEKRLRQREQARNAGRIGVIKSKLRKELRLRGSAISETQSPNPSTSKTASQLYLEYKTANNCYENEAIKVEVKLEEDDNEDNDTWNWNSSESRLINTTHANDIGHEGSRKVPSSLRMPNVVDTIDSNLKSNCILCYQTVERRGMKFDGDSLQDEDMLVMLIVQKMFKVPKDKLALYLTKFGNPRGWINCCNQCLPLIKTAFNIQKSIATLEENLHKCKKKMLEKIRRTWIKDEDLLVPKVAGWSSNHNQITNETRSYIVGAGGKPRNDEWMNKADKYVKEAMNAKATIFSSTSETACVSTIVGNQTITKSSITNNDTDDVLRENEDDDDDTWSWENFDAHPSTSLPVSLDPLLNEIPNWSKRDSILDRAGYNCEMCPSLTTMRLHSYIKHVLYHYKHPYQCSKCTTFYSGNQLELTNSPLNVLHDRTHTCSMETLTKKEFKPGKIWECGHCSEVLKTEEERDSHEKVLHHQGSPIPLYHTCGICLNMFRNWSEWRLHRALTHPESSFFSCFHCDESFKYTSKDGDEAVDFTRMRVHMMKMHSRNSKNENSREILQECDLCGKNFSLTAIFRSHMELEHGIDKNQAYRCPICYKRVKDKTAIKNHLNRHSNSSHNFEKAKHICDICGYGATDYPYLEHMLTKHGIEPPKERKLYVCSQENCSFKSMYKTNFEAHMVKSHGAARKLNCQQCGKGFLNARHHREHMNIHKNATTKPFQCEICGNSFAVKNYLYIHMRLSHQNRPFASTHKKRSSQNRKKKPQENAPHRTQNNQEITSTQSVQADSIPQESQQMSTPATLNKCSNISNADPDN